MKLGPESGELLDALDDVAAALAALSAGVERVVASVRENGEAAGHPLAGVPDATDRVARLLSNRLGEGNHELVLRSAERFAPGERFTLSQLADAADATPRTA